jgi:hypothetical protein
MGINLSKESSNLFMIQLPKFLKGDNMAAVIVEKACGCFRNSDFEQETHYDNVDEALEKANEMCIIMNEDFCHKHTFKTQYVDGNVMIKMEMNG